MGAWIETVGDTMVINGTVVAPYVGAWIETSIVLRQMEGDIGRTLRGCVD